MGGFGSAVLEALDDSPARVLRVGLPDRFVDHGKRELLLEDTGPDPRARRRTGGAGDGDPSRVLLTEG